MLIHTTDLPKAAYIHLSIHPKMCLDYNTFEINKKYCGQEAHLFKKKKKTHRETIKAIKFILKDRILQYSCLKNSRDRGAWLGYSLWACKESDMTE